MAFTRSWVRLPSPPDKTMADNLIDPEIADLLGDDTSSSSVPDFSDLFNEPGPNSGESEAKVPKSAPVDLSKKTFAPIDRWEQEPDPSFAGKEYYGKVLTGEGEVSQRFHGLLQKYLKTEDPQEHGLYRQRLIPAWWDLARSLAEHYRGGDAQKRTALRFGCILPTLISAEQRRMLSKVVPSNDYDEPIHYIDEWFDRVADGTVTPLATDEVKTSKKDDQGKTKVKMDKAQGSKDSNLALLQKQSGEREGLENDLKDIIQTVVRHASHPKIPGIGAAYTPEQKQALGRAAEMLRRLGRLDHEIVLNSQRFVEASSQFSKLGKELSRLGGSAPVDSGVMGRELDGIRQMAKMCVGRQGNHVPFLMKNFFFPNIDLMGTRENVIRYMDQVEQVDSGVFHRTFRQTTNRIVPNTIIIPCYGDKGICWEPFELLNRSTSRGRIAVPMFPKNLKLAVIYALADLRWSVAKEKAQHYWMEEGLTGHYYQWFDKMKLRGDVRIRFLEDYVLWITKEVEGVQKLDKNVRGIFWRYMPFPQPVKDTLRKRGFVYDELYKKDMNRAASDGY